MQYNWFYQLFHKNTTFTVFVRLLKKQLFSRVLVRLLKKAKFYALQLLRKQNLTHPKASKLATLHYEIINLTSKMFIIIN